MATKGFKFEAIKGYFKKVKSAFVPVVVSSSETQSYQRTKSLPDSKWVAEVITSVIRGLL